MKVFIVMSMSYEGDFIEGVKYKEDDAKELKTKLEKQKFPISLEIQEWEVD